VNETSRATGSRWGGIVGYRLAEAAQKTASKPAFRRLSWALKKYAVLMYATDELLQDVAMVAEIFRMGAGEELNFMLNDDILNGNGAAGPFGILNSTSLVTVAAAGGQGAATFVTENISAMWAALHPRFRGNAAWFVNSEVEPQLDKLSLPSGTGALEPRYVTFGPDGVTRIKGKPVIVTEFNAALGTVGDVVLANLDDYLLWERGPDFASSIHLRFDYDEQVFRAVYRCDGLPATPKVTQYKGSLSQSAFVALATR
jgi:HK97 family phage major capsid protein